jgi:predicted nucleotide-binding protein (sugar kinase/HSP70/actin superfamily)
MLRTNKRLEIALEICDKQDRNLDEEQERLTQRRQMVKEQREILEGAKEYITSCGGEGHLTVGEVKLMKEPGSQSMHHRY